MTARARAALALVALTALAAVGCGPAEAPQRSATDAPEPVVTPSVAVAEMPASSSPTEAPPTFRTITGEVFYRERLRLPSNAAMTATLLQLGDSGDTVIARSTVTPRPQVPIPFELEYPTADISENATYGLQIEITRRGEVVFALPEPALVITKGAPGNGLRLLLTRRP